MCGGMMQPYRQHYCYHTEVDYSSYTIFNLFKKDTSCCLFICFYIECYGCPLDKRVRLLTYVIAAIKSCSPTTTNIFFFTAEVNKTKNNHPKKN